MLYLSVYAPIIVLVLLWGRSEANLIAPRHSKLDVNHKKPLKTFRPYNVAHRGSSGRIPEETTSAYLVTKSLFSLHIKMRWSIL